MFLANPKTLAAMEARQIEAQKNASKGSGKKVAKSDVKEHLDPLPNISDLLQLSDGAASAPDPINFSASPVQNKGAELLLARQLKEGSPSPLAKPKKNLSPPRQVAVAANPSSHCELSPDKHAPKAAGRDNSSSPIKSRSLDDKSKKSPVKAKGAASQSCKQISQAEYDWSKRESELLAELVQEKNAATSLSGLVSELQRDLAAAKQRLIQVESGSELSHLQFSISNLEQLLRQSEQERVGLLQVICAVMD
jgi:hypothetical protein